MSTVTPLKTTDQLAQTIRHLRLENEELKQSLAQALEDVSRLKNKEKITLKKIHSLMEDIKRYKKQLPVG